VQHVAVLLEHVHLLNASDRLHGKLLERSLQLLVLAAGDGALGLLHHLAAGRTLTAGAAGRLQLRELLLIHHHAVARRLGEPMKSAPALRPPAAAAHGRAAY